MRRHTPRGKGRSLLVMVVASLIGTPAGAAGVPAGARVMSSASTVKDGFTFAAAGDTLGPYEPVTQLHDPRLEQVLRIIRSADAAFANHEGSSFDLADFRGSPSAEDSGTGNPLPLGSVAVARDYRAMGLDLFSKANNHATDWGLEGLLATQAALRSAGLVYAGSGCGLAAARSPAYFDSPRGRVGLVATASSYQLMAPAGPPIRKDGVQIQSRPGISVLRTTAITLVSESEMASLREIAARSSAMDGFGDRQAADARDLRLGGATYRVSDKQGVHYEMNEDDVAELLSSVHEARANANLVVFSIHAHETASGGSEDPAPADFLPGLFHRAIDAGADIVVRHGPHALKAVEIYRGKPIFYGMASLFFNVGALERATPGRQGAVMPISWDESAIALTTFRNARVAQIRLYPIVTVRETGPLMGTPRLAEGERAQHILQTLKDESAVYGTEVRIEGGIGIISGH